MEKDNIKKLINHTEKNTLINFFSFIACIFFVGYGAYYYFWQGNYFFGYLYGVIFLSVIINFIVYKYRKNETFALYALGSLGFPVLIPLQITGGVGGTGIFWYYIYIVWVFFLIGKSHGALWIFCLFFISLGEFILQRFGYLPSPYSLEAMISFYFGFLVQFALVFIYQNSKEEVTDFLKKQSSVLSDQSEELKKEIEQRKQIDLALKARADELEDSKKATLNLLEDLKSEKEKTVQEKVKDEALLESIGEGMIAVDSQGVILVMNTVAREMLQLTGKEIAGKKLNDVVPIKDSKGNIILQEKRPWYAALLNKQKKNGEYIFVRSNTSEFPVGLVVTPVMLNNEVIGGIELFRDISDEKMLDRAKSEFVALASHQLRTPISAISWFTEMLLNGDSGPITEEQKDHLTKVYLSSQRMAVLVDALLNVSRLEMGDFFIKPQLVDLAEISHRVLTEELEKQKTVKELTVIEKYDEKLQKIPADPDVMKIIFQNLFSNAMKYTPANGTINVTILLSRQNKQNSDKNKEEGILISVADTGYGIQKNQEEKIFTKLFRADNIKEKETDGTGLGLYIVKSIVEEVEGKIWFESTENKGSTFFVLLPKNGMIEKKGTKALMPTKSNR